MTCPHCGEWLYPEDNYCESCLHSRPEFTVITDFGEARTIFRSLEEQRDQ